MTPGQVADAALPAGLLPTGLAAHAAAFAVGDAGAAYATPLGPRSPDPTLSRAVAKRQAEWVAGRYCAEQALRCFGIAAPALPRGADRAPLWPEGMCGSIAHSQGRAVAVAGVTSEWAGLGIDIEGLIPEADVPRLGREIATPGEMALAAHLGPGVALTLLFSAKEAIYKAISARAGRVIGFHEATCTGVGAQEIRFHLAPRLCAALNGQADLTLRHVREGAVLCTFCGLPA